MIHKEVFFESIKQESFAYKDFIGQDGWNTDWTVARSGFTEVGTPTLTGRFHVIGRQCFFQVQVIPSTSVATTGGTSYIELPITAKGLGGDGSMTDRTTLLGIGNIVIDVTNSRAYVPTQAATADTLLIAGWYEI